MRIECPRPDSQVDVEIEWGLKNPAAQQIVLFRVLNGRLEPANGERILSANVNETLICPNSIGGNGHALQDAVRVAL